MGLDRSDLDTAVLDTFGDTYTYIPTATDTPTTFTASRHSGERFEAFKQGVHASLFCLLADLPAEPVKGDLVTVPSGREIRAGSYRVADIEKNNYGGRYLLLQWAGRS